MGYADLTSYKYVYYAIRNSENMKNYVSACVTVCVPAAVHSLWDLMAASSPAQRGTLTTFWQFTGQELIQCWLLLSQVGTQVLILEGSWDIFLEKSLRHQVPAIQLPKNFRDLSWSLGALWLQDPI